MADKSEIKKGKPQNAESSEEAAKRKAVPVHRSRRTRELSAYVFGNFISAETLRRNIGFIVLVVVCMLLYIGNGYSSQQELIEANKLKGEVEEAKYNALVRSSELLEKSRQSYIEEYLESQGDTTLKTATVSPYVLKIDSAE